MVAARHPATPQRLVMLTIRKRDGLRLRDENGVVRKARAAAGSLLFLALAPGVVAGVVPWWITGWRVRGGGGDDRRAGAGTGPTHVASVRRGLRRRRGGVRPLVRGTDPAQSVRRGVRDIPSRGPGLVAAPPTVGWSLGGAKARVVTQDLTLSGLQGRPDPRPCGLTPVLLAPATNRSGQKARPKPRREARPCIAGQERSTNARRSFISSIRCSGSVGDGSKPNCWYQARARSCLACTSMARTPIDSEA